MFHHDAMFVMHHVSSRFIIVARLFLGHLIELLYGGELLDPKNSTSHHSKRLFVLLCDTWVIERKAIFSFLLVYQTSIKHLLRSVFLEISRDYHKRSRDCSHEHSNPIDDPWIQPIHVSRWFSLARSRSGHHCGYDIMLTYHSDPRSIIWILSAN